MDTERISPHETYELHELLTFKTLCATKSDAMSRLVKDEPLKTMLQDDFNLGKDHILELKSLLKLSEYYEPPEGDAQRIVDGDTVKQ